MMKQWNVWLIFTTFLLTLLGTLLTRAGLVSSVHAFAQSSIGDWFVGFMAVVLAVCLFTYILQRDHLKSEHKVESLVSRESSFAFNNVVLLAACFTILWGTLFPVLSEYVEGTKTTLSGAYYSHIAVPIGVFLLFLTGVGPLLAWRASSLKSIRRNFVLPTIAFFATAVVCLLVGLKPWKDEGVFYSLMTISLAMAVTTAIASEFLRGAGVVHRQTGKDYLSSTILLVRRSTRRYGGFLVHVGIVIIFIGFAGYAFNRTAEQSMGPGDTMQIGPYTLKNLGNTQESNANYDTEFSQLDVYENGKKILDQPMAPEKRVYLVNGQPQTMVANHSTMRWDLYVVYEGKDQTTGLPIIKAFLNPLVMWIWVGLVVVVVGTLVALVPSISPQRAVVAVPLKSKGPIAGQVPGAATGLAGGGD
jgi:cytochrome c-type biogenesis protein CcmF